MHICICRGHPGKSQLVKEHIQEMADNLHPTRDIDHLLPFQVVQNPHYKFEGPKVRYMHVYKQLANCST